MRDELTPVERVTYREEVKQKRCLACNHASIRVVLGVRVVEFCRLGRVWPKAGVCRGFSDDCQS